MADDLKFNENSPLLTGLAAKDKLNLAKPAIGPQKAAYIVLEPDTDEPPLFNSTKQI